MRKCVWFGLLLCAWVCSTLTGCNLISWVMGTEPETADDPPIKTIIGFMQTIPGIGTAIATGLGIARWGWVEIAHKKLINEGKKDDNNDGVDDALQKPPSAPAV